MLAQLHDRVTAYLRWAVCGAVFCTLSAGCAPSDAATSTLYRSSALDTAARIHVATFDAGDGDAYNTENGRTAADLFAAQPGTRVRFWCERGRYRP